MQLVNADDPVLTTPCREFDFSCPPFDPTEFAKDIIKFMYEKDALGVAANQVGLPYAVFAMRGQPENFVCFNPKLIAPSDEQIVLEEGCLTYPGLIVKIKRPRHVRVRFQTPNGEMVTKQYTGMTARVFQHELDHIEGTRFYDRANKFHKDQAFKRWKR